MARIKYDINLMKFISVFEAISNARVKDAIEENGTIIFIVEENQIAKAIGKNGSNVKRLERIINKRIKVVEFSNDLLDFIRNYVAPLEIGEVRNDNGHLTIKGNDMKTKSMLIGRDRRNINLLQGIAARYFDFRDIRVV